MRSGGVAQNGGAPFVSTQQVQPTQNVGPLLQSGAVGPADPARLVLPTQDAGPAPRGDVVELGTPPVPVTQPVVKSQPPSGTQPEAAPSFAEPSISPDGSEIAFVSGGDIWTVPTVGGEARLLVAHPATESRPLYSPDGKRLAFMSDRDGHPNIYTLDLESGQVGQIKRLTFNDGRDQLEAWSHDGRWIYFSSTSQDMGGMSDVFRVSAEGGTPMPVSADRYSNEYFSAPSPAGSTLAFTAHGINSSQWWRQGHSHLDESQVWLMHEGATPSYEPVTENGAKDLWPMWTPGGHALYYVSDRGGAENIWVRKLPASPDNSPDKNGVDDSARQVTHFTDGRVLWPNISPDGKSIVFERDFNIWKLDTQNGQVSELPITRRGAPVGPAVLHATFDRGFRELALSPDGKKLAFVAYGDVFAASTRDGGEAFRVTHAAANESQIAWSPDSKHLVYASDRDGESHLFEYDFTTGQESRLTNGAGGDASPHFAPDGGQLAFVRGGKQLCVIDLESGQERVVASGYLQKPPFTPSRPFVWSPDSRWIAYLAVGDDSFENVHAVPAAGGPSRQISFLGNTSANTVSWSADGSHILFDTDQYTESGQLACVRLIPEKPTFSEDAFRDLFKDDDDNNHGNNEGNAEGNADAASQKPVDIAFDGIRRRLSLLPVGLDIHSQTISPDGKTALVIAGAAGQENLYVYSLDTETQERPTALQLTATWGAKSDAQFSPDGTAIFYLDDGAIHVVPVDGGPARKLDVTAQMDVDFAQEKREVFHQAWSCLRDNFFDPRLGGLDWDAVRARYEPRIAGAATPDEVRRLISLMIGELNASHLGIYAPQTEGPSVGRTGLGFDRAEYETSGNLKVTQVLPNSPADVAGDIHPGDYVTAVNGQPVTARTNLDQMLDNQIGRRVVLSVAPSATAKDVREVAVRPIGATDERRLRYREWVEQNRAYVANASGGRLGYVHMADMMPESLNQLYLDLDSENQSREGVVVDIRNNNGGNVNAYALDVLSRRGYLKMTPRDLPTAPARRVLGQRALELPTILLTNQNSLSDGEDFAEGYRSLKLGKVVGEPTAGWIIFTGEVPLIDGSTLRIPFSKVTASDGSPMEMHPRPVDVPVQRPVGESYSGRDAQLDTAVRELLAQIDKGGTSNP